MIKYQRLSNVRDEFGSFYLLADYLFKNVLFGRDEDITKWYLSKLLQTEVYSIQYLNTVIPKDSTNGKSQLLDVLILVNDYLIIDIEANSHYYKSLHERNLSYAMSIYKRYKIDIKDSDKYIVMLIDLTKGLRGYFTPLTSVCYLQNEYYEKYVQSFVNLTFDIDKALKLWYIGDKQYYYIAMLAMNAKELLELSKLEEISDIDKVHIMKIRKELVIMSEYEKDLRMWKEREEITEASIRWLINDSYDDGIKEGLIRGHAQGIEEGIEEGLKQGSIEGYTRGEENTKIDNAIRMLKNGLPIDLISKCVDLSQTRVKELEDSLVAV